MVKPADAPRLHEWMTASEAAEVFGVSRETVNQMCKAGDFESLHLLGSENRPQYVIRRHEVEQIKATRRFPRAKNSESRIRNRS